MKNPQNLPVLHPARIRKRSFFCIVILTMAMTYFLVLALLFFSSIIFTNQILNFITPYYQAQADLLPSMRLFTVAGAILYTAASSGILLFLLKKKAGFYIFFFSALILFTLDLLFLNFDWLRYLIQSGFIFILGIAHFSKRCYA